MKVKDLIAKLKTMKADEEVFVQLSGEDDGYAHLRSVSDGQIWDEDNSSIYDSEWTFDESGFDYEEEWDEMSKRPTCVLLIPNI